MNQLLGVNLNFGKALFDSEISNFSSHLLFKHRNGVLTGNIEHHFAVKRF